MIQKVGQVVGVFEETSPTWHLACAWPRGAPVVAVGNSAGSRLVYAG
jgi:hypothetical protein